MNFTWEASKPVRVEAQQTDLEQVLVFSRLCQELALGHPLLHWLTEKYPSGALTHNVPYTIAIQLLPLVDFDVKIS